MQKIQEQGLNVTVLKDELRKLKGKGLADNIVSKHTIDLEMLNIDVEYLNPRLLNNSVVEPKGTANVQHSKLNANSELLCVKCNGCMLSDNHNLCVLYFINDVNARNKSKSVKKIGNACPLNRITTTADVPLRKPTALASDTPKPVVLKSVSSNKKEPSQSWGSIVFDVPSSSLDECRLSKLFSGTVKFGNDHVEKILGYGDYQIGNVTISRFYYVEGLGHNLFSVRQFCDSNL
ncbi:hypothetical protein Tco_1527578 [Tanacetum coccineum]